MLELLSIFAIEVTLLHVDIQNYTMQQRSIHCIIMVFMWAFFIGVLLPFSRKHYHFPERGSKRDKISSKSRIVTLACFIGCKIMTFIDWHTLKIAGEVKIVLDAGHGGDQPRCVIKAPAARGINFAARSAKTSLMSTNQGKRKRETKRDDWTAVEEYLKEYIGDFYEIEETSEKIYISADFPDEYASSESRIALKGAVAKAKANAAQAIPELIRIAANPRF